MTCDENNASKQFSPGDNSRVTKLGNILRKTKIDELPELFNVVNGDMSIVGPRPEVAFYVEAYREDFVEILKIRPGLSDLASIKYRAEEMILQSHANPEQYYLDVILPDKLRLARQYLEIISFKTDLRILGDTLKHILLRI
jgi:lipopolysaccharide/colanic/teichoic acid biosynthesis glycosyltransferase